VQYVDGAYRVGLVDSLIERLVPVTPMSVELKYIPSSLTPNISLFQMVADGAVGILKAFLNVPIPKRHDLA
jgi:hypothetical protein